MEWGRGVTAPRRDNEGDEGGERWGRGGLIEKSAVLPGRQASKEWKQLGGAVLLTCRFGRSMMNSIFVASARVFGGQA